MNKKINKQKNKDWNWNGNEPMTGTPMTGDIINNQNYDMGNLANSSFGTAQESSANRYIPNMRADADKEKKGYDIKADVEQSFSNDPNLKNNIATPEFDYTKEETMSWDDSHVTGADKNRQNKSYK